MGNSEVGHLNLGAGKPVLQDLPRIDAAIADGSFFDRGRRCSRRASGPRDRGRLHIVGLVGPGGVHAHDRHLSRSSGSPPGAGVPRVRVHALLDGRDTPPRRRSGSSRRSRRGSPRVHPDARIASVGGRYYAMDRDQRWERTERGYDAIVHAEGAHAPSASAAIGPRTPGARRTSSWPRPSSTARTGALRDGDPIVHVNFRADRARQLVHALAAAGVRRVRPDQPGGPRRRRGTCSSSP